MNLSFAALPLVQFSFSTFVPSQTSSQVEHSSYILPRVAPENQNHKIKLTREPLPDVTSVIVQPRLHKNKKPRRQSKHSSLLSLHPT